MQMRMHLTSNLSRTGEGQLLRRDVMDGCWDHHGCLDAPTIMAAGGCASVGVTRHFPSILVTVRGVDL